VAPRMVDTDIRGDLMSQGSDKIVSTIPMGRIAARGNRERVCFWPDLASRS
jgi:hypothetical protein